jgi:DNA-binding HxlR family transcriptional regulator
MLGRTYDDQVCSIARSLGVLGDRWTLLIVRDVLLGLHRFEEFQRSLGVARNVLTDRLNRLVDAGVLERVPYQQRPVRYDYQLSATGRELAVPLIGLMHWGDRHLPDSAGPPRITRHRDCGGALHATLTCADCGQPVPAADVEVLPGPGLRGRGEHALSGH